MLGRKFPPMPVDINIHDVNLYQLYWREITNNRMLFKQLQGPSVIMDEMLLICGRPTQLNILV